MIMTKSCLSWDQSVLAVAFCNPNGEHERIKCYRVALSSSLSAATPLKKKRSGTMTTTTLTASARNGENTSSATGIDLQLRCTLIQGSSPSTTVKGTSAEVESPSGEWTIHKMYFVGASNNFLLCCHRAKHPSTSNTTSSMMLLLWDLTRGVICQRLSVEQQQFTFMDGCLSSTDNTILHILFHDKASHKHIIYEYAFTDCTTKADGKEEQRQYIRLIRKIKAGSSRISSSATNHEVSTDATSWPVQQLIASNSTYISTLLPHKDSTHSKLQFIDALSGKRVKIKSSSSARSSSECYSISSVNHSNAIIVVYRTQTDNNNNNDNNDNNVIYAVDICECKKHNSDDDGGGDHDDDDASPKKSPIRLAETYTYEGFTSFPTCFATIPNKDNELNNNSGMVVTCNDGKFYVCIDTKMEHTTASNSSTTSTLLLATAHALRPHTLITFHVNNNTKDVSIQLYTYHQSFDDNHTTALSICLESASNGKNHLLASTTDKAHGSTVGERTEVPSTSTTDDNKTGSKRKATSAVIMGPGETLNVASGSIHEIGQESKKMKKASPDEPSRGDNDVDDNIQDSSSSIWDLVCHEGTNVDTYMNSIASRIAVLRRQMANSDNDDDSSLDAEDEGDGPNAITSAISGPTKKKPVQTSSNALTVILKQALQSSNEIQLEEAFAVTDESVVKATIASITDDDLIWTLLMRIIHRISKKPSRAVWLGGVWLKTILEYHSSTFLKLSGGEGESLVYNALGPLANMLKERTELLPHLMRLQGRFNMISRHHGI